MIQEAQPTDARYILTLVKGKNISLRGKEAVRFISAKGIQVPEPMPPPDRVLHITTLPDILIARHTQHYCQPDFSGKFRFYINYEKESSACSSTLPGYYSFVFGFDCSGWNNNDSIEFTAFEKGDRPHTLTLPDFLKIIAEQDYEGDLVYCDDIFRNEDEGILMVQRAYLEHLVDENQEKVIEKKKDPELLKKIRLRNKPGRTTFHHSELADRLSKEK